MDNKQVIQNQFLAALEMLKEAVVKCPQEIWNAPQDKNKFWQVAYHALFYVHLYLQDKEEDFHPWEKHRQEYQFLGQVPWPPHDPPKVSEPYTREEVMEYQDYVCRAVCERVPLLNLEAASGFYWLKFGKLELQLYNLRHIQHHTGELFERLGVRAGTDLKWVGTAS
jgi:hypothetical protein